MHQPQRSPDGEYTLTLAQELEFLTDASVISPQTLSDLLSRIPDQTALHAPISVGAIPTSQSQAGNLRPPTSPLANLHLQNNGHQSNGADEKQGAGYYQPSAPSPQPPPSYGSAPPPPQASWPPLCQATALYAYSSADKGDLELQPNDHVAVIEYMNAEWWKGRSSRTGQEGIFPRSYVRVIEEQAPQNPPPSNYGNMPVDVSQSGGGGDGKPNQAATMGKKFGKKLGNAAIFGAGATMGADLVNSIF